MAGFGKIQRVNLHQQVAEELRGAILDGELERGERLPTERELSDSFGVSRATVREAIRALQAEGLVTRRAGRGIVAEGGADPLPQALEQLVRLNQVEFEDLLELRLVIEAGAVARAAALATEADLEPASEALEAMRGRLADPELFLAADIQFHLELARASRNPAIHLVMVAIREVLSAELTQRLKATADLSGTLAELTEEHQEILGAVRDRDAERATSLVESHLRRFYRA